MLRLLVAAAALCTVINADETVTLKRDAPAEDEPEVQASMNSLGGAFMPAVGEDYENEAAKEAERKAALSPLERLAEFGKDVSTSDGPAAVADKALKEIGVLASEALATGYPNQVGWGFCAGYCTGFAAKKVGKVGFVVVGSMYALL